MANFKRKYPLTRLRRLRSNKSIRDLVAENKLSIDDLIQPIFVKESLNEKEEIESLVGIFRHSEKSILKEIEELVSLGIKAVAIFPVIDEDKKDEKAWADAKALDSYAAIGKTERGRDEWKLG